MAPTTPSTKVDRLETKLKKVLENDLTMTQRNFHAYTSYKKELEDLIDAYYGMLSPKEERTLAYLKAEVGSRVRQLNAYLQENGGWKK